MGMFSTDCKGCEHPLLSKGATNEVNSWMTKGVAIFKNGDMAKGSYDGYGRLGRFDAEGSLDEASVYHEACHEVLGKPLKFAGHSRGSADQGWFFDEGAHDFADPRKAKDPVAAMATEREKQTAIREADLQKARRAAELREEERGIIDETCPLCGFDTHFPIKLADGSVAIRCPNRDCNVLRTLSPAKQAALIKFAERNPDFHTFWDDEQVNEALSGLRSAREEIKRYTEEYYEAKAHGWEDEATSVEGYLARAKEKLQAEERIVSERKTLGLDRPLTPDDIKLIKNFAGKGKK